MRFIESILFQDGVYHNLPLHQKRVNRVFSQYAKQQAPHNLAKILPNLKMDGMFKVRMVYDMDSEDATYDLEYAEYLPRKINSLEVVHADHFDYSLKYEDRSEIEKLISQTQADDIIIAIDDYITDGSYFNLAFFDGNAWFTPNTPLLCGIRRQQLLNEGVLKETTIRTEDLSSYEKVSLINAMLDLSNLELPMDNVTLPPRSGALS